MFRYISTFGYNNCFCSKVLSYHINLLYSLKLHLRFGLSFSSKTTNNLIFFLFVKLNSKLCNKQNYIRRILRYSIHLSHALSLKFCAFQKSPKSFQAPILLILISRAFQPCMTHWVKETPWLINLKQYC